MKIVYSVYGMVAGGRDCDEKFAEFDSEIKSIRFIQKELKRTRKAAACVRDPGKYYRFTIREDFIHDNSN